MAEEVPEAVFGGAVKEEDVPWVVAGVAVAAMYICVDNGTPVYSSDGGWIGTGSSEGMKTPLGGPTIASEIACCMPFIGRTLYVRSGMANATPSLLVSAGRAGPVEEDLALCIADAVDVTGSAGSACTEGSEGLVVLCEAKVANAAADAASSDAAAASRPMVQSCMDCGVEVSAAEEGKAAALECAGVEGEDVCC